MARSILRASRVEKHQRLFELIRQGNLASQAAKTNANTAPAAAEIKNFQRQAEQSMTPQPTPGMRRAG